MRRKIIIFLLCLLPLCCFAGCSRAKEEETDEKLIVVGFSQVGSESDWRLANTASMVSALSEENGYHLLFDNAKQRQENQYLAIRNFIQQDVDYIVIAPISETGWESVLAEARAAGIPVILVDRQVNVEDQSLYRSWVGSDFYREGTEATAWIDRQFADRPLRILHLQGTEGATASLMRSKALYDAAETHPSWQIEASLKGDFTEAKGYEVTRDFLSEGGKFDLLYSENDNMTFGAMQAMDEAGITYGEEGTVKIVSFDCVKNALEECLKGKIDLCVECNPLHGPRVDALIKACEAGEELPRLSYVEETAFSSDTITRELIDSRGY